MPTPLSTTRTKLEPPLEMAISILVASPSRLFSTSSLTTDAGRSTTSPAATCEATSSGRKAIRPIFPGDRRMGGCTTAPERERLEVDRLIGACARDPGRERARLAVEDSKEFCGL